MAEASPVCGTFDQSGNVRQHEPAARPQIDHAKSGVQRREGIVGNFGRRGGYNAQEGRFAGIRQTQQACIRDQFQA